MWKRWFAHPLWTKHPWKSCELIHGKFTGVSKDFNGIFMGNLTRFFMACHPGKSMKKKNIKKAIKNSLIFQFSWAMKTLKFWANPWNTHENTMTIFGCFSLPFNGIENAMNYKEGFSWCCSSWSFHEATEFGPWKTHGYSINIERLIDHENVHGFFMAFWRPMKINNSMVLHYFHGVNKI